MQEDQILLLQWQEGDPASFSQIVKKYLPKVIHLAHRYLKDRSSAEDIAQEIFIKLYQNPTSWKPTAKFSSWLYRVTFNACMDEWRKTKKVTLHSHAERGNEWEVASERNELEVAVLDTPRTQLVNDETRKLVQEAIDSLPEDQKRVILLYQDELSYEQIAEVLGCSVKAVERRLYRARQRLNKRLKGVLSRG